MLLLIPFPLLYLINFNHLLVQMTWESKLKKGHGDLSRGWEQLLGASTLFTVLVKGHNDSE